MTGSRIRPSGVFTMTSRDPHGNVIGSREFHNGATTQGLNHLLDSGFRGGTQYPLWYVGLIDDAGFSAVDPADTHQLHAGWAEYTGLFGGNRGTWTPAAAASGFLDSINVVLSITATGSVRGALLASQQAIGTTSGQVLYATGVADSALPVVSGGTVTISYKLRLTPR